MVKGIIIWLSVFTGLLLIAGVTEWIGNLSAFNRTLVVAVFALVSIVSFTLYIIRPIIKIITINRSIPDDVAARKIGSFFPAIGDKLLNFLELSRKSSSHNSLIQASLHQRANSFENIEFAKAIDVTETRRPLQVFIPIAIIIIVILLLAPGAFLNSTNRIINFRKEYVPEAPFKFIVNSNLSAYQNEDYQLVVNLKGSAVPAEVFYVDNKVRLKMAPVAQGGFALSFSKLQQAKTFHLEAAGFSSPTYSIKLIARPSLNLISAQIKYPNYLKRKNEYLEPVGELEVPEGTTVEWHLRTQYADAVTFHYNKDSLAASKNGFDKFVVKKRILNSGLYGFLLESGSATQKGKIEYSISSIKDEFPKIQVQSLVDTLLFRFVTIGGEVSDDYGLSQINLVYQKENQTSQTIKLPLQSGATHQQVFTQWLLDSLMLDPGDQISYFVQVFDNDRVNGAKSAKSQTMYLKVPSKEELEKELEKAESSEKSSIDQSHKKSEELRRKLDETLEGLKGKKELTWEDKQNIKDVLKEKEKLQEKIEELKKQNELLQLQRNELQKPSPELEEKAEQLQNLMNDLLDEETRKLYEELQKLLQEQAEAEKVQSLLQNIQNKELNLEEELERTLELFKRLQVEQNLEKVTEELNELAQEQDSLANSTENKENSLDDIKESQEEIKEKFDSIKENLEDTKEKNNELKRPESFEDTSGDEEQVDKEIDESLDNIEKNNRKNSSKNQKNSSKNMKSLAEKLEKMQGAMQMQQMQEDISNLRGILENLITLSYAQEQVMKDFRNVNQSNPEFVTLSEQQIKIQDDSKIIKDSLLALANRVMVLSSFVTRELNEMNDQLKNSSGAIKDRKQADAVRYQQLSMTSMNNLALMLDNVLQQMQESMADAMGKGKNSEQKPIPGMSELQEHLNNEIRELQQSGKTGKELSQELAKLAAKQEMIRKALREAEEKIGDKPGEKPGGLKHLQKQMEDTELDLVNKDLSKNLQRRQQQILTRLLEAEKALREQELDPKREAQSGTQYEKELPRAFEEYLKQKQKEIELIKTIPPKLHPYYKKEVNKYFERLKTNDN